MARSPQRLARIVAAWSVLTQGSAAEFADLLDERVVWQGLEPELHCDSLIAVMSLLERYVARPPRITRLEAQEAGDRVAISMEGPDFPPSSLQAEAAPRSLVFTFRRGRVIRMESFPTRDAAFAALASR